MPRAHKYKNKEGYYIKARHGSAMVTYQLSADGVRSLGLTGRTKQVDPATLARLVETGEAYTHGNGPGVADSPPPKPEPKLAPRQPSSLFTNGSNQPPFYGVPQSPPPPPPPAPSVQHTPKESPPVLNTGRNEPSKVVYCRVCGTMKSLVDPRKCWDCGADASIAFGESAPFTSSGPSEAKTACTDRSKPSETHARVKQHLRQDTIEDSSPTPAAPRPVPAPSLAQSTQVERADDERAGSADSDPREYESRRAFSLFDILAAEVMEMAVWLWLLVLSGVLIPATLIYKVVTK